MKKVDGWWWPDGEQHMLEWMANPKNRLILNGRAAYQGAKQLATMKHCGNRRGTAVDAGAHIGLWSWNLIHHFKHVHAFEPVAAHRACFERNLLGAPNANVTLHPCALGDREATVNIRVNPKSTGDSWVKGVGDIPQKTIDNFAFKDVDFIKIDAEGYEEFIVRGATETIVRCEPVICVEQKRDMACKFGLEPRGAVRFLEGLGYKVAEEIGGDFIMVK